MEADFHIHRMSMPLRLELSLQKLRVLRGALSGLSGARMECFLSSTDLNWLGEAALVSLCG